MRLDIWLHGRGDTLSEIAFIDGREKSVGEFTPEDTFVLHPYGRFMNAFKFAGEVDVFEALAHAQKHYPIDENRLAMRGFSMGGAGAWHLGAHHAGTWAAVNPGAGFVDVKNYQNLGGRLGGIPWYEQKLRNLYDPLACPINLANTSLIAYSGEIDEQKKAADLIEAALAGDGVKMTHIIGPQTGHKYEPEAKKVVARLVDAAANKGRDPVPRKVSFVTYSLKWNQMHWVRIDALERHWEKAEVTAEIIQDGDASRIEVKTRNVAAISLNIAPVLGKTVRLVVDGQDLGIRPTLLTAESPASWWKDSAIKTAGKWEIQTSLRFSKELAKRHDLQGPIDDAFMDSFIFVQPTGPHLTRLPANGSARS
jgi:dienelactone hydrolase